MKEIYKNPILYYILTPIMVFLWPLIIWGVYLPRAQENWQAEKTRYTKAQKTIEEILAFDPERLDFADSKTATAEFDYASAIERIASSRRIPPTNYRLSSGIIMTSTSGERKTQNADVTLTEVDITKFAEFLSAIQLRWASLQCERVKLTKKKGLPDKWDVNLGFKYYY